MKKSDALKRGYCHRCAAYDKDRNVQRCGLVTMDRENCSLTDDTVERWKTEFGLDGATKSSYGKDAFGNYDLMKKRKGAFGETKYMED